MCELSSQTNAESYGLGPMV